MKRAPYLSAGIRIDVDLTPGFVRGSREELRSAFGNIVSNAVRYTPDGGIISLAWREDASGGRFEVSDTGSASHPITSHG